MRCVLVLLALALPAGAQLSLSQRIAMAAQAAKGSVYVACSLPGVVLDCNMGARERPPMQSSFKLPLAMVVLHMVETGKLQLDQPVRFAKADRYETFSPFQQQYPEADVDIPLRHVVEQTIETSDNIGADLQWRLIGGAPAFQSYMDSLGLAIHQKDSERTLHGDQRLQYRDYAEPAAYVALLRLLADHSPLTPEHTAMLLGWMQATVSGPHRIKALLPPGTPVAHRTGSSGEEFGRIPATVDAGLITLPDGRRLAIAIFVTDAHGTQEAAEHVIAEIARMVYDASVS